MGHDHTPTGGSDSMDGRGGALTWQRATLAAAGVTVAILYSLSVTPQWRIHIDSALYLSYARNLATHGDDAGGGSATLGIPPAVPMAFAALYSAVRSAEDGASLEDVIPYINAMEAFAAIAAIAVGYCLVREWEGEERGIGALALLATSVSLLTYALMPLTDVPYALVSWSALLFTLRFASKGGAANGAAAAMLLVLAPLTRVAGMVLVVAACAWMALVARRRGKAAWAAGAMVVVPAVATSVAVGAWIFSAGGGSFDYTRDLVAREISHVPSEVAANLAALPDAFMGAIVGRGALLPGAVLLALAGAGAVRRARRGRAGLLDIYGWLYVGALLVPRYRLAARYLVPLVPVAYVWVLDGLAAIHESLGKSGAVTLRKAALKMDGRAAAVAFTAALAGCNLAFAAPTVRVSRAKDFYGVYQGGFYADYMRMTEMLGSRGVNGRIMARQSRVIRVLCEVPTAGPPYQQFSAYRPGAEEIDRYVRERGVAYVLVDPLSEESAGVFEEYMRGSEYEWRETLECGRLRMYELARADGAAGPREQ